MMEAKANSGQIEVSPKTVRHRIPLLPPSSKMAFPNLEATCFPTMRPTFSLPVNDTLTFLQLPDGVKKTKDYLVQHQGSVRWLRHIPYHR